MSKLVIRQPVPVLVINLDRDVARWDATRDAFAEARGFAVRRSPGVIPALPRTAQSYLSAGRRVVQAGTLGVFLAHVLAWETVAELDGPALIVEDDVKPGPLHRLFALDLPGKLDVLYVNHRMADPRASRRDLAVAPAWSILEHKVAMPADKAAPGGDGYLLTPEGARKLLDTVLRDGFDDHVDWRLFRYGCPQKRVDRIRPGTWLTTHRPLRVAERAPAWQVVRSFRLTSPLILHRGGGESSRELVTRSAGNAGADVESEPEIVETSSR